jgi:hypothetical protein
MRLSLAATIVHHAHHARMGSIVLDDADFREPCRSPAGGMANCLRSSGSRVAKIYAGQEEEGNRLNRFMNR